MQNHSNFGWRNFSASLYNPRVSGCFIPLSRLFTLEKASHIIHNNGKMLVLELYNNKKLIKFMK